MSMIWKKCLKGVKVRMKTADEMRAENNYFELRTMDGSVVFANCQNKQIYWEEQSFIPSDGVIVKVDKSNHILYVNFNGSVVNLRPQILKEGD